MPPPREPSRRQRFALSDFAKRADETDKAALFGGHDPPRRDLVMCKKLVASFALLAAGGCRMCSDSCDYSPPVAGSPHDTFHTRAGAATDVGFAFAEPAAPQPLLPNPPVTPTPAAP